MTQLTPLEVLLPELFDIGLSWIPGTVQPATIAIPVFLFFLSLIAISYYGFAIYAASQFFAQPIFVDPSYHPPVSILKPVCGLDKGAYDNLASFCQQDYPNYQIIFGVQSPEDSSLIVVQQLIQDFPEIDIRYVISQQAIGTNLKVTNLAYAATEAIHEILLLADSDIRVGRDYLQRVVQPLSDRQVGVVTCMYRTQAKGWAAFEALSTTTEFLPSVLVARKLEGVGFALGATIAIRTSVLEAIGGFPAIANYLEDDFLLGQLPARAGHSVVISDYVVQHGMVTENLFALVSHQTRWMRGNRYVRPMGYTGLIFTYGTVSSLLFWFAVQGSAWGWAVLGVTLSARLLMAWVVGVKYLGDSVAQKWLWWVPVRDLISFMLWGYSFLGNTVEWRGRKFRLSRGGRLTDLTTTMPSSISITSLDQSTAKNVGVERL